MLNIDEKLLLAFNVINDLEKTDFELLSNWKKSFVQEAITQIQISCDDSLDRLAVKILCDKRNYMQHEETGDEKNDGDYQQFGEILKIYNQAVSKEKCFVCDCPTSVLEEFLVNNAAFSNLKAWVYRQKKVVIREVQYPTNDDQPFFIAQLEMPEQEVMGQLEAIQDLYKSLGLKGLGNAFVKVIDKFSIKNLSVQIGITNDGLYVLGIRILHPSREEVLFFTGLTAKSSDEKLAVFESVLNASTPDQMTYSLYPDRWRTELFYNLK